MTAMLPEPAYVLSPRPVRPDLLVFYAKPHGYSGLYKVSLKRYSRYECFTCCKSIAMYYRRIYDEQQAETERRKRKLFMLPSASADKPDEFGITERGYTILAVVGIVLGVLLVTWLVRHIPAMI